MTSPDQDRSSEVSFWNGMGASFPSLKGAASTKYYFECERMLFERFFPTLKDRLLLKTDLWDEAKNTEILRWAAEQGARPVGVDIAFDTVQQARDVLKTHRPGLIVSDVRSLPFSAEMFDLIYSMGTIEHFPEYEAAVRELFRVLKPHGLAIIGVPNKLDPFLRPLLVLLLDRLGLYAYGMEKSFTPRGLRQLLESAGFRVTAQTSLLFLPGWLRMLDLVCHIWVPWLAPVTGWLIRPFAWLYRRVPMVRRHGYLIAAVVERPRGAGISTHPGGLGPASDDAPPRATRRFRVDRRNFARPNPLIRAKAGPREGRALLSACQILGALIRGVFEAHGHQGFGGQLIDLKSCIESRAPRSTSAKLARSEMVS